MNDASNLKLIAVFGIAIGFVLGIAQASESIWNSRILIVSLMLSALASVVSWIARLLIVGRLRKDVDPPLPGRVWAASYFLTALIFGLFCVFVLALGALIAGLVFGWDSTVVGRALMGSLLLVALFGTSRGAVLSMALISNRTAVAKSRPMRSSDI